MYDCITIVWIRLYEFVQKLVKKRFASGLGFQPGTKIACNRRNATPSTTPPPPLVPILFIYRTIRLPSKKWDCTNSSVWHIVIPFLYKFIQTNSYSCYTNCLVRICTRCGFCTNSYSFYTNYSTNSYNELRARRGTPPAPTRPHPAAPTFRVHPAAPTS
jgi:hypothetical protein